MYQLGLAVKKDQKRANHWYRLAAQQNSASALYDLGAAYFFGDGVPVDQKKAEQLYIKAAERGNVSAQARLGYLYAVGDVTIKQDLVKGYMWLMIAASRGNAGAKLALGRLAKKLTAKQLDMAKQLALYHQKHDTVQPGVLDSTYISG